jgi:outer membrane protein OmpA-like peptidoglycan-associated protein
MAYIHIGDDSLPGGSLGCGPGCRCGPCRSAAARLGEWYVRDEESAQDAGPPAPKGAALQVPGKEPRLGWTMGEPPPSRRLNMPPMTIRVPPFRVLHHFEFDRFSLRSFHPPLIHITAQHVVASWNTAQPIRTIRLVGHTDPIGPEPYNIELARRRALEVKGALINAIERLRPSLSQQINIVLQTLGESRPAARERTPEARARNRRVEVFLSTMAAAPVAPVPMPSPVQPPSPAPSRPVRIPTPEEAARAVVPLGPETPEERIRRILTRSPPTPPLRGHSARCSGDGWMKH